MTIRLKTAAIAVASALAVGAAAANDSTATGSQSGGTGVLGSVPQSTEKTSVFAVDETEFMRLDTDHDGRLSREETTGLAPLQHDWQRVDVNRDDYLSREELARYHAEGGTKSADAESKPTTSANASEGLPAADPTANSPSRTLGMDNSASTPSGPSAPSAEAEQGLTILVIGEPEFVRLDKDGDGQLSRSEAAAIGRMEQSWDAMDANRDGLVSRDELRTYQGSLGKGDGVHGGESRLPADRSPQPTGSPGATSNGSTNVPDSTLTQPSGSNTPR